MWVGYDEPREIGRDASGGVIAVPIWTAFMKEATRGQPAEAFKTSTGLKRVALCPVSGERAGKGCYLAQEEAQALFHSQVLESAAPAETGSSLGASLGGVPLAATATATAPQPLTPPEQLTPPMPIYYDYVRTINTPAPCPLHPDAAPEPGVSPVRNDWGYCDVFPDEAAAGLILTFR